jgi:amino acid permease
MYTLALGGEPCQMLKITNLLAYIAIVIFGVVCYSHTARSLNHYILTLKKATAMFAEKIFSTACINNLLHAQRD